MSLLTIQRKTSKSIIQYYLASTFRQLMFLSITSCACSFHGSTIPFHRIKDTHSSACETPVTKQQLENSSAPSHCFNTSSTCTIWLYTQGNTSQPIKLNSLAFPAICYYSYGLTISYVPGSIIFHVCGGSASFLRNQRHLVS